MNRREVSSKIFLCYGCLRYCVLQGSDFVFHSSSMLTLDLRKVIGSGRERERGFILR